MFAIIALSVAVVAFSFIGAFLVADEIRETRGEAVL